MIQLQDKSISVTNQPRSDYPQISTDEGTTVVNKESCEKKNKLNCCLTRSSITHLKKKTQTVSVQKEGNVASLVKATLIDRYNFVVWQ